MFTSKKQYLAHNIKTIATAISKKVTKTNSLLVAYKESGDRKKPINNSYNKEWATLKQNKKLLHTFHNVMFDNTNWTIVTRFPEVYTVMDNEGELNPLQSTVNIFTPSTIELNLLNIQASNVNCKRRTHELNSKYYICFSWIWSLFTHTQKTMIRIKLIKISKWAHCLYYYNGSN